MKETGTPQPGKSGKLDYQEKTAEKMIEKLIPPIETVVNNGLKSLQDGLQSSLSTALEGRDDATETHAKIDELNSAFKQDSSRQMSEITGVRALGDHTTEMIWICLTVLTLLMALAIYYAAREWGAPPPSSNYDLISEELTLNHAGVTYYVQRCYAPESNGNMRVILAPVPNQPKKKK